MQKVVMSLEQQSIGIHGIDKNKGIQFDSVYGLKCVPDNVHPYSLNEGREIESKMSDMQAKLKQLSDENTELRDELTDCKDEIQILDDKNMILTDDLKDTKEVMWQMIQDLQRQQARSDAELTKNNRKIDELEAAHDVNQQQNSQLSAELKGIKEQMGQKLQHQQARSDAELKTLKDELTNELGAADDVNKHQNLKLSAELKDIKTGMWQEFYRLREKADEEFTALRTSIQTSWGAIINSVKEEMRSFYSLSGEIFQMNRDFKQFDDNFKKYNEKIETQIRKYEGQITEWAANMETTMKEMHQVMEDHKMSYPRERPLIWEKLKQLEEHGIKNQEGVDGLRAYAKQKTKVGDQLYKCEINLDALQTEMAERGDETSLLYKTERTNILTRLVELKRISDNLLADNLANKEWRALADDDNEIE